MDDGYTLALTTEGNTSGSIDSDDLGRQQELSPDAKSIEVISQQLRKWLDQHPDDISEQQFTALVQKCGIIKVPTIAELFGSLDYEGNGKIPKQVLLQNNYLASLISRLYADQYSDEYNNTNNSALDVLEEEESDEKVPNIHQLEAPYQLIRPLSINTSGGSEVIPGFIDFSTVDGIQRENDTLKQTNAQLSQWIETIGKPATQEMNKMRQTIVCFQESELAHKDEITRLYSERASFMNVQREFMSLKQTASVINEENDKLNKLQLNKQKSIDKEQTKLRAAQRNIKSLQSINEDLMTINDRYRKENDKWNREREAMQEECKTLRLNLLEKHDEFERMKTNAAAQIAAVTDENTKLYQALEEMETKLENHENKLEMMEPNGIINQLCPGLEFNHTITIKKPSHLMKHSSSSSIIPQLAGFKTGQTSAMPGTSQRASLVMREHFGHNLHNSTGSQTPLNSGDVTADVTTPFYGSNSTACEIDGNAPEYPIMMTRGRTPSMSTRYPDYSSMLGLGNHGFGKHKGPDFSCTETEVDCIIEESWSRQMEQEIVDKVKGELKEKYQLEAEQIKLDAKQDLEKEKNKHQEDMDEMQDRIKRLKLSRQVLKDQYKGELKLLRQRVDELEEELEGWRNSQHYRKKAGKSAYNSISEVDSTRMLDIPTDSSASDSRRRLIMDEDYRQTTCRVNWGFLFGRKN